MFAHDPSEPVEAFILMIFFRWGEFHCLAALHASNRVTRRVVAPKRNTERGPPSKRRPVDPLMRGAKRSSI